MKCSLIGSLREFFTLNGYNFEKTAPSCTLVVWELMIEKKKEVR